MPGVQGLFVGCVSASLNTVDAVICIHCLSWPPQATDWPIRHRNYSWPDSATIDRIVSNGCDVVQVAHRQCRRDEWMSKHQWRLSFSRAEIVLINSWMPVQQIINHMLRCFTKTQRLPDIRDNSGAKIFSNYHLKTPMLWACELKARSWWTDNLNVVRMCVELLHTLAIWLTDSRYPQYFINNCNLFDSTDNYSYLTHVTVDRLKSISEKWLSEWFIQNYIQNSAQLCPGSVSRLFDNVCTSEDLQKTVSLVVAHRLLSVKLQAFSFFATGA